MSDVRAQKPCLASFHTLRKNRQKIFSQGLDASGSFCIITNGSVHCQMRRPVPGFVLTNSGLK
jgi:hypothetical protein